MLSGVTMIENVTEFVPGLFTLSMASTEKVCVPSVKALSRLIVCPFV
jgi:hypothetical protein